MKTFALPGMGYVGSWGARAASSPVIRDGLLVDDALYREWSKQPVYDPFGRPGLPNALGKVKDERSALEFARRFGPLGYTGYQGAAPEAGGGDEKGVKIVWRWDLSGPGDPTEWVYAQARSVRLVLELLETLEDGRQLSLETVFRRHCPYRQLLRDVALDAPFLSQRLSFQRVDPAPQDAAGGTPRAWYVVTLPVARGDSAGDRLYSAPSPRELAASVITDLVNENTQAMHQILKWDAGTSQFSLARGALSLVEVIWWHVATAAVDGQVKLCDLCHAPFIVTDRRQRFCPAAYDYLDPRTMKTRPGRSRCAALYQKRKERGLLSPEGKS